MAGAAFQMQPCSMACPGKALRTIVATEEDELNVQTAAWQCLRKLQCLSWWAHGGGAGFRSSTAQVVKKEIAHLRARSNTASGAQPSGRGDDGSGR